MTSRQIAGRFVDETIAADVHSFANTSDVDMLTMFLDWLVKNGWQQHGTKEPREPDKSTAPHHWKKGG